MIYPSHPPEYEVEFVDENGKTHRNRDSQDGTDRKDIMGAERNSGDITRTQAKPPTPTAPPSPPRPPRLRHVPRPCERTNKRVDEAPSHALRTTATNEQSPDADVCSFAEACPHEAPDERVCSGKGTLGKGTLLIYPGLWIILERSPQALTPLWASCPEPHDHAQEDTPITSSIGGTHGRLGKGTVPFIRGFG